MIQTNPRLELAEQYVCYTSRNIFLTGKAGTGKTTFLRNLKNLTPKRMVIVAPTGVAAINAGGVTIHSFFQLPFSPFIPDQESAKSFLTERKFSNEKIKAIKAIDLLIIDEISMVRADLLDAMDQVLRRYRIRNKPFGGVQLLMIGDLHQLAPVIKDEEWNMIKPYYSSIYFFESLALKQSQFITIELDKIYRQDDEIFIHLLNKIRNRVLDRESIDQLNTRYRPDFVPAPGEEYIILTTHNHAAQSINQSKLLELKGKSYKFDASIQGEFPEPMYPNEFKLELKTGAQIMFVRNDASRDKLYFNGKLGVITKIEGEGREHSAAIHVRCKGDHTDIIVLPVTWNNIKYVLDDHKVMQEQIIGTFSQYPIKTAWAITIHKSQGLTFDRAIIDAQSSFAHGQVYVALSRCKTFEGLVLSTPIHVHSVKSDSLISTFNEEAALQDLTEHSLLEARRQSQAEWINELFEFKPIARSLQYFLKELEAQQNVISNKTLPSARSIQSIYTTEILSVADKFQFQLPGYFNQPSLPEENQNLQDRIKKGSQFLYQKLNDLILIPLKSLDLDCDNNEIKKTLIKSQERSIKSIYEKLQLLKACYPGFNSTVYIQTKANASIDAEQELSHKNVKPKLKPGRAHQDNTPDDTPSNEMVDQDLYAMIKSWRDRVAEERGVLAYMILPIKTIKHLCYELPGNLAALSKVNGFGKAKLSQYGDQIIGLIISYCKEKGINTRMDDTPKREPVRSVKGSTQQASYDLFKSGKSIAEIAKERKLGTSTIEGHLADFISKGKLDINAVINAEKVKVMIDYSMAHPSLTPKELKETFGDNYTYGEIRMIKASLGFG
jgi:hypothetical protein